MSDDASHITPNRMQKFYGGELSAAENRVVVRHLLTGCPSCKLLSDRLWQNELSVGKQSPGSTFVDADWDASYAEALEEAHERALLIEQERNKAPELLAELIHHPPERLRIAVLNTRRLQTYGFCEHLLETAFQEGFKDAKRAVELAKVGVALSERLRAPNYSPRILTDLRARAWGTLGNALRISSDFAGAARALAHASTLCEEGTGDPLEEARLIGFNATLAKARGSFDEALALIDRRARLYQTLGDDHMVGESYVRQAAIHVRRLDYTKAKECCLAALNRLDAERSKRHRLVAISNLTKALIELGEHRSAEHHIHDLREGYGSGLTLDALRVDWLEGQLFAAQKRFDNAEVRFRHVLDGFIDLEIPIDAALATLDLAEALYEQDNTDEMKRHLASAIPIFQSLGIHREAIAAMTFLRQQIEREQVTVAMIQATARFVAEIRNNAELRFNPQALGG